MTADEKREADACASYLGLPLSTFFRFAARQVFNENRQKMIDAGCWQDDGLSSEANSYAGPSVVRQVGVEEN